jgi:signal transduction histidine kinase
MAGIELSLSLGAAEDTVWADPNQLRQVFLNLSINAADAISAEGTEATGKLHVNTALVTGLDPEAKTEATYLKISFTDNGQGIAAEDLENIFDPFFTTKDPGKGTGLGLAVSFMIIESLGGKLTGVSEAGQGTTMTISLPLYKAETSSGG